MAFREPARQSARPAAPIRQGHLHSQVAALLCAILLLAAHSAFAATDDFEITLDAREAPRGLLHASLSYPVQPGPLTLLYPKWIPGEHGPTGPVRDLVELRMEAAGQPLDWQRDARDLNAFRTTIPSGAKTLRVELTFLLPTEQHGFSSGRSSTSQLAILSWHYVMLYPAGKPAARYSVHPHLLLPEGWRFGTALRQQGPQSGGKITFGAVPLPTLVDSPVLTGKNFRQYQLPTRGAPFGLYIAADNEVSLEASAETIPMYSRVAEEELALFGSHPFEKYDFLLALSDHIAQFGLEHHESSDNRLGEKMLLTDGGRRGAAGMLAHELVHSWNGKARRPADMVLEDFQQPQATEMLWVYEGLTNYLESLIPVRAGLWSEQDWRDHLAIIAADQSIQSGRAWRSLADTSISAQLQFDAPHAGADRRRNIDFYEESDLIWLEADVTIRQLTGGKKSLNDFCRQFFGKPAKNIRTPDVSGYRYADLVAALNDVARYDWEEFFRSRVYRTAPRAPLGGIEKAGWRLAFQPDMPGRFRAFEEGSGYADFRHTLGFILHREDDGKRFSIEDIIANSPADRAGLIPGMTLTEVNGTDFTPDKLRQAISASQNDTRNIELIVEYDDQYRTIPVAYHDGERYPYLERDPAKPDAISEITRPLRD